MSPCVQPLSSTIGRKNKNPELLDEEQHNFKLMDTSTSLVSAKNMFETLPDDMIAGEEEISVLKSSMVTKNNMMILSNQYSNEKNLGKKSSHGGLKDSQVKISNEDSSSIKEEKSKRNAFHSFKKCNENKVTQCLSVNYCDKHLYNFTGVMPFIIKGKKKPTVINSAATRADRAILDKSLQVFGKKHLLSLEFKEFSLQRFEKFPIIIEKVPRLIDSANHLMQAVFLGDMKRMRQLVAEGFPIDSIEPATGQTALHISVSGKNLEILKELLEYIEMKQCGINYRKQVLSSNEDGSDTLETTVSHYATEYHKTVAQYFRDRNYVNDEDCNGLTVLMMSVKIEHKEMIEILIAAKADIAMFNEKSKSALQLVFDERYFEPVLGRLFYKELCRKFPGYKEIAQILVEAGCLLHQACCFHNSKIIEYMINHCGFSPNSTEPHKKLSALHISVIAEDVDTVKLLLKSGANVNACDIIGSTPLLKMYHYSKKHNFEKLEILKILLNTEEVSLTSCNLQGLFQISNVLIEGNREAIRIVMQSKIDFMAIDKLRKSNIFHYLAFNENPDIVKELEFSYVNKYHINSVDTIGHSPIHVSVYQNNFAMVHFLLDQQAIPTCPANKYGYTPMHHAYAEFVTGCEEQFDYYIERLLQNGMDPQCIFTKKNGRQITLFDIAESTNNLNRIKPVIAHLAILQGMFPIKDIIVTKINFYPQLKEYFDNCQKLISRQISGSITLRKLLCSSEKSMARYLGQVDLILTLARLSCKQNLKFTYPYYYSTLQNKFLNGMQYRKFLDKISEVITAIFEFRINKTHIVIDNIIKYLDQNSLQQLYHLSEMTP